MVTGETFDIMVLGSMWMMRFSLRLKPTTDIICNHILACKHEKCVSVTRGMINHELLSDPSAHCEVDSSRTGSVQFRKTSARETFTHDTASLFSHKNLSLFV